MADEKGLERKLLNNSLMESAKGILFLKTINAKSVKKNAEFLKNDAVLAMKVVR